MNNLRWSTLAAMAAFLLIGAACSSDDEDNNGALPGDFPVYEGAARVDEGGTEGGAFGVYRTADDLETVRRYFEEQLRDDGWTVETEQRGEDTVIRVQNPDDPAETGSVVIREEDGETQIVETVGKDEGAATKAPGGKTTPTPKSSPASGSSPSAGGGSGSKTPASTAEASSGGLPSGYPSGRVPLPSGITITDSRGPVTADNSYSVDFDAPVGVDVVVAFFMVSLEERGWTKELARPTSPFTLQYRDGADTVLVTGNGGADSSVVNVTITIGG